MDDEPHKTRKQKSERGKNISGALLVALVAYTARDTGLVVFYRSRHKRSYYLKKSGSQFKLRISDHQFSKGAKWRHMSVVVNHVLKSPMDAKDAIALGSQLADDYARKCGQLLEAASHT